MSFHGYNSGLRRGRLRREDARRRLFEGEPLAPGDREVVMETLPDSTLSGDLTKRGYDVRPASPPEVQRILPVARTEHIATENSTGTIAVARAGVVKVLRYVFPL
jgi:hypothetical protein